MDNYNTDNQQNATYKTMHGISKGPAFFFHIMTWELFLSIKIMCICLYFWRSWTDDYSHIEKHIFQIILHATIYDIWLIWQERVFTSSTWNVKPVRTLENLNAISKLARFKKKNTEYPDRIASCDLRSCYVLGNPSLNHRRFSVKFWVLSQLPQSKHGTTTCLPNTPWLSMPRVHLVLHHHHHHHPPTQKSWSPPAPALNPCQELSLKVTVIWHGATEEIYMADVSLNINIANC